ncbi:cell division protein CrgA [Microbacterium sp. NPDC096154]|uniref:cell division protein CrgA n=1 Tax=Microbacterium sp. NPDC096154 TaxID=3155549 RepID=UPI00331AE9A0
MARSNKPARQNGDDELVERTSPEAAPNPVWFKPVMIGFMLIGLVWILVFYLSGMQFPIPGIEAWNLVIGFGIAFIGFLMTTRWR